MLVVEELVVLAAAAVVLADGVNISEIQQVASLDLPLPTSMEEQVYNTILLH